jgi:hypothetical protein
VEELRGSEIEESRLLMATLGNAAADEAAESTT